MLNNIVKIFLMNVMVIPIIFVTYKIGFHYGSEEWNKNKNLFDKQKNELMVRHHQINTLISELNKSKILTNSLYHKIDSINFHSEIARDISLIRRSRKSTSISEPSLILTPNYTPSSNNLELEIEEMRVRDSIFDDLDNWEKNTNLDTIIKHDTTVRIKTNG